MIGIVNGELLCLLKKEGVVLPMWLKKEETLVAIWLKKEGTSVSLMTEEAVTPMM